MTACTRFAPMLGARPGELSEAEARERSEHLASCDACQARLADEEALAGMLGDALLAEANQRDFATFSDEVLERIPGYGRPSTSPLRGGACPERRPQSGRSRRTQDERGETSPGRGEESVRGERSEAKSNRAGGLLDWVRHHRLFTAVGTLAPALAALALVVYVGRSQAPSPGEEAAMQISAEGKPTTVLDTSEGPVVLFGDDEPGT